MNILLIGSGGREHAIAAILRKSPTVNKLFSAPGNPGILEISQFANINLSKYNEILDFCKLEEIDLVVIGPEQPLAEGLSDYLRNENILVFGPSQKAALLESSKSFAKEFMKSNNIPTANFETFNSNQKIEALEYLKAQNLPIVIKADGLAAGKGVIIANTLEEANSAINEMFDGIFGDSGKTLVIEEFMEGDEASIFAICDGKDFVCLAPAQDHKRIFEGDLGKNTGGMGSYAPAPLVNDAVLNKVKETIIQPVLNGMNAIGSTFIGCLFVGLMIKDDNPKVVEFNVRFGDPETQSVLSIFEGDLAQLFKSAAEGNIDKSAFIESTNKFACCVVAASNGYPDEFQKGYEISGLNEIDSNSAIVFQAGTKLVENKLVSNGGRVLSVVGLSDTLKNAVDIAYQEINKIKFENIYFRKDIAYKALK